MANQITDNRTSVDPADAATNYVDLGGSSAGTADSEILIQGSASVGEYLGSSLQGLLYNVGSTQNWSGNTFYIWINCGIVGLLDTKANGGFRIRFTGATVTDWFEVYVAGSDEWPTAIAGGWTQFVVDIDEARAAAVTNGWTNGTTPATTAIQRVGWAGITGGTMPRMVDNTWIDEIRRLPANTPGIIVEGRNGGSTDWDSADIATELGIAVGTFVLSTGGAYKINTPIQFGINDTTTHGFTDTNAIWLWDNQEFLPDDFYEISALGNSGGTTDVTFGLKAGTGDDATGSQGLIISAADTGARWSFTATDANLDNIDIYGCSFVHGATFSINNSVVEFISNVFIDCNSCALDNSEFIRNVIVNANTADGVAFATTDDLTDVVFCDFSFSDGHGIEITSNSVDPQISKGNSFTGYGADASNDAAVFNDSGGSLTISVTNAGDSPTVRTTTGSTTVENSVPITITVLDTDGDPIEDARVEVSATETVGTVTSGDILLTGVTNASGVIETLTFNYELAFDPTGLDVRIKARQATVQPYKKPGETTGTIVSGTGLTTVVALLDDE